MTAGAPAAASAGRTGPTSRWRERFVPSPYLPPVAVGLVITAVYWLYAARQWATYTVPSWDLGIFTQVVRAYAELRSPIVPIKGDGFMILGDHFHPLLVVLAPFYALHPSGFTLLAAQAVLFGLTAAIVTWYAVRHAGLWPGLAIGSAAGLSYALAEAAYSQFHELALALPLLAMSMAALLERRHRAAALWALPLLGVKEDLGLTVAAIGVVIALRAAGRGERRLGLGVVAGGLAAFVAVTTVILPALNPTGVWDYAGQSIVSVFLSDPGEAVARLFTGVDAKLLMMAMPFVTTALVSLRSPLAIVLLPTFAWRVTSDNAYHWGLAWHYGAIAVPIVFLALLDALPWAREAVGRRFGRAWRPLVAPVTSAAVAAVAVLTVPAFPLWDLTRPDWWAPSERADSARRTEALIPDDAMVSGDITLMAYLAPRTTVMWLGNDNPTPDYVVVDQASGVLHPPPDDIAAYAAQRHPEVPWAEISRDGTFLLARATP